jgi:hypothetical protein
LQARKKMGSRGSSLRAFSLLPGIPEVGSTPDRGFTATIKRLRRSGPPAFFLVFRPPD